MSGPNVFGVARSVWDHPALQERRAFSRREAWIWLVSEAGWKQRRVRHAGHTFTIERGQLAHSIRFMAKAWRWEQTKVVRFVTDLKTETMITTETATGITVTTICNYDRYQVVGLPSATAYATPIATETQQERNSSATNKKQVNRETGEEDAASAAPRLVLVPPATPEQQLFERGKEVLGQNAGGMIQNLLKAKGRIELARAVIETAATKQNAREYVAGAIRGNTEHGGGVHRQEINGRKVWVK
jgi:hypothetical protein